MNPNRSYRESISRSFRLLPGAFALVLLTVACEGDVTPQPGDPLPDLTEAELGRFLLGKALFSRETSIEEGLGPSFNQTRCDGCHALPVSGGSAERETLLRKARRWENGTCDLLEEEGGDLLQDEVTPALAEHGFTRESVPPSANIEVELTAPSVFGLGLIEAIPEADIVARADPDDADGDGISGRLGRDTEGRVARFTRKAEWAILMDFVDAALRTELGLTTPAIPVEETVNGVPIPPEADPTPEPEIDQQGLELLTDFVRYSAPPPREPVTTAAARDSVSRGERLFDQIGCADCHTPYFDTGPNEVAALDRKRVPVYSDLLLHDMGPESAGLCGQNAEPTEYRTSKLWGLRFKESFLHDGRAATIVESVVMHGGESQASVDAFEALGAGDQAYVLKFLSIL